jgi:hypothetical protein
MSTIEELDRLVLMINEKANDLEFLSGLNRLVDAYTNDRSVEGMAKGKKIAKPHEKVMKLTQSRNPF